MALDLRLFERKRLAAPTFYLSTYLEARREEYYDRLLAVSRDGDWTGWCVFFLGAIIAQAESNTRKVKQILDLYETKKDWIVDQTRHTRQARQRRCELGFKLWRFCPSGQGQAVSGGLAL
ncbi:MAG: Adenosine monophosphate-protein transferase SoFic [Gammaproteobacteria bacterium]|nr:Adenosine monophosphate-protein transferase SoFic [Gammaproteobacteria bacterium]